MTVQAWCARPKGAEPDEARFAPVVGVDCLNKPGRHGSQRIGLWTSTWLGPEAVSDWVRWCVSEQFSGPAFDVWLLHPDAEARLWEIDTADDLDELLAKYGRAGPYSFGDIGMFPFVDFDAFAADGYVGVHLTEAGQWRTRGIGYDDRPMSAANLYGWDCESTLWTRWAFASIEHIGVIQGTAPAWQDADT